MIQFMRSTSSAAASQAPLLQAGQPFYETDTHKLKIGDGSTAWNDLPYIGGSGLVSSDAKVIKIGVSSHTDYDVDTMDYNCDGTDDQEQFSEAISRLYSTGGTILVYPGNYYFSANLDTSYFSNSINSRFSIRPSFSSKRVAVLTRWKPNRPAAPGLM